MKKSLLLACMLPVCAVSFAPLCSAAQSTTSTDAADYHWGSKLLLDYEHLTPTTHNRHITTDTVDAMMGHKLFDTFDTSIFAGVTATKADGHITRNDGVDYDSSANGLGPVVRLQIEPWHAGPVGLTLFASGGLIFYDESFPSDARHYNFMWRVGPTLNFKLTDKTELNAGASWMHVSNGHKTRNPGYDGSGLVVGLTHNF